MLETLLQRWQLMAARERVRGDPRALQGDAVAQGVVRGREIALDVVGEGVHAGGGGDGVPDGRRVRQDERDAPGPISQVRKRASNGRGQCGRIVDIRRVQRGFDRPRRERGNRPDRPMRSPTARAPDLPARAAGAHRASRSSPRRSAVPRPPLPKTNRAREPRRRRSRGTHSTNVTLLISRSVVLPERTCSTADSRRKRIPSSRAAFLISETSCDFSSGTPGT